MGGQPKAPSTASMYAPHGSYSDHQSVYSSVSYGDATTPQHNVQYSAMPPVGVMDQSYASASVFPTPPVHHQSVHSESSPESYQQDQYSQHDISDVLGALKLDEIGTAPYLNNKSALLNREEEPAIEEVDDFKSSLPPMMSGSGLKIRIPPELMPDEETILQYFDLYFANVHPYVPVLNKAQFYNQWHNNRESISPLLLEAIFAVAGRLADEPAQGQQWIALASTASQGRSDLAVDPETVDFNLPRHIPGFDESEYVVSRNFVYFIRIVRTMNRMIRAYSKIKRKKDWGLDPDITKFNPTLTGALDDLPADLAITFPTDGWL
ncbi:putative cutinase transcription factor 1 alpha protein [Eutypa lata UCREL1]|uniref:Putative cutinase transcription factor 1 alpha protein n=1 Tax=Eutypa lata (strain UCR-EL1) TaxID=1287681 RepID=M7SX08_EUTLA|nr:putative cutinase transcription factor 1 alpha protein [Eutypa lata UCREL1]